MLILIAVIAAVTFIRSMDTSLKAEENPANLMTASPDIVQP
jgi:hypothetical protein